MRIFRKLTWLYRRLSSVQSEKIDIRLIPYYAWVTPAFVEVLHAAGVPMWPWTVNDDADLRAMLDTGVDGIITNHPDRLTSILAE